jgi:hypothetical protein
VLVIVLTPLYVEPQLLRVTNSPTTNCAGLAMIAVPTFAERPVATTGALLNQRNELMRS